MSNVKRVTVGGMVRVDVDGTGNYIYGRITDYDAPKGKVTVEPSDGTEEVVCRKDDLEKATAKQLKEFAAKGDSEPVTVKPAKPAKEGESIPDEDEDEDEELGPRTMSSALRDARSRYEKAKLPNGRETAHNNDRVAKELHGKTLEEVKSHVAKQMGTSAAYFTKKYGHLNRGHQRMLIGNAYRKYLKGDE